MISFILGPMLASLHTFLNYHWEKWNASCELLRVFAAICRPTTARPSREETWTSWRHLRVSPRCWSLVRAERAESSCSVADCCLIFCPFFLLQPPGGSSTITAEKKGKRPFSHPPPTSAGGQRAARHHMRRDTHTRTQTHCRVTQLVKSWWLVSIFKTSMFLHSQVVAGIACVCECVCVRAPVFCLHAQTATSRLTSSLWHHQEAWGGSWKLKRDALAWARVCVRVCDRLCVDM